ncbi:glycosyltransferase family 2 protein [Candidatus Berkelbacteria bacterium]|nr:glycosyltransferase family 2 protein [Candidatus Berkelbacteria bacterium]
MKNFKSIAVVVLNWNGEDMVEAAVLSLLKQSYQQFKIIIVDNGSTDNSRKILEKLKDENFEKIELIFNEQNLGFALGVNVGIKHALDNNFDFVGLFNNDAVAEENWLEKLVESFDKVDNLGGATCLLLHKNGKTIDSTGDWYSVWGLPFPRSRDQKTELAPQSGLVFGVSGGASLYSATLFKEIGLFDERFFAYFEDVDISFRAQLAGYKFYFNKEAIAYHTQGATSKKFPGFGKFQMFKNLPQLFIKNVPLGLILPIGLRFLPILLLFLLRSLLGLREAVPTLKGFLVSFLLIPGSLLRRREVQGNKKVTNQYLREIIWWGLPPKMTKKLFGKEVEVK